MSHLRTQGRSTPGPSERTGPATERTVSATITALTPARAVWALTEAGFDAETEARRLGLPEVTDPDFTWRVPLDAVEALFERGIALCGPDFPLAARPRRAEDNRSPVLMYTRTRRTVREGLAAACELIGLVTDGHRMRFDEDPTGGWVTWSGRPRPSVWWFEAADAIASIRSVISSGPWAIGLTAPFEAPPGVEALFGCRCEPGPSFAMRLPTRILSTPLAPTDPAVRAHVERQVEALRPRPTAPGVVAALWAMGPTATAARLAEAQGISERTLHRWLALAGTSFRTELDAVRSQFAGAAADRSAEELAVLLGYSDVRAYRRAARRWCDSGP